MDRNSAHRGARARLKVDLADLLYPDRRPPAELSRKPSPKLLAKNGLTRFYSMTWRTPRTCPQKKDLFCLNLIFTARGQRGKGD